MDAWKRKRKPWGVSVAFASCAAVLSLLLVSCGGGGGSNSGGPDWYRPQVTTSWQIQLQVDGTHPLNTSYIVDLYDLDLFETSAATVSALHGDGHKVICYFSTAYEDWRPDATSFTAVSGLLGNNMSGWAGERWVDIRKSELMDIMKARMDIAVNKGCDGVDPDNVHAYELGVAETGFTLTAADQLAFNLALAAAAHERGLAVGLKNDISQASVLADNFDFSINEECYQYNECSLLNPFIAVGKPVFHLEYDAAYSTDPTAVCADSLARNHRTLIMPLGLDDTFRISCD